MRFAALFVVSPVLVACTETPSYFPPCVNPNAPCVEDGGADAADGGEADAPLEAATTTDAH